MKRVGLKDVAKEAGVSASTVSYVVNSTPTQTLTDETIKRVNAAIEKLGYVPNMAARALVNQKSKMLGVIIPQTEQGKEFMLSNPFYGDFVSAVEYEARLNGYHIMISGAFSGRTYDEVVKTRGLDGVIIVGIYKGEDCERLSQLDIPVVLVDSYCEDYGFQTIQIDDQQGSYMATKYLLERGHRRIAHVTGQLNDQGVNQRRYCGFLQALDDHGSVWDISCLLDGTMSFEHGISAGEQLAAMIERPDAVVASSDVLAAGVCKGLRNSGVRVPEDISVIGFDDSIIAQMCVPTLTTIRQDVSLKGRKAVELLLDAKGKPQKLVLPLALVERESVRKFSRSPPDEAKPQI